MRELTGATMRREYDIVMKALSEKFLNDDDVSIVVGDFLEKASMVMSSIQNAYNKRASDRENAIKPVLQALAKLKGLIEDTEDKIGDHLATGEPEDNNRDIER